MHFFFMNEEVCKYGHPSGVACIVMHSYHAYNDNTTPRVLERSKFTGSFESLSKLTKLKYM